MDDFSKKSGTSKTIFRSITMLYGKNNIPRCIPRILSVPHNIVMDMNNAMFLT